MQRLAREGTLAASCTAHVQLCSVALHVNSGILGCDATPTVSLSCSLIFCGDIQHVWHLAPSRVSGQQVSPRLTGCGPLAAQPAVSGLVCML